MVTENSSVLDAMFKSVQQVTEANLRLQQDLLLSWTRYWPGFTGRQVTQPQGENRFLSQWYDGILRAAETHRELLGQQFDMAIETLDTVMGIIPIDNDVPLSVASPPTAPSPPTAQPPTKVEPPAAKQPDRPAPQQSEQRKLSPSMYKNIRNKIALVTGAASGIGEAVSRELAIRGAKTVLMIDRSEEVQDLAKSINQSMDRKVADAKIGDTTDEAFRKRVFNDAAEQHGIVTICVPAAGITRDALSVTIDKATGKAKIYPIETFRQVTEVNLVAPIYWGMEMVARIAEDRRQRGLKCWEPEETIQGVVVFLGSVSSQGNKGQIAYACAKAGLEGATATLTKEAMFHGVRCGIIHPGFTDTPMARKLGDDFLNKNVLPFTQLGRLIHSDEIADAICFMISNSAITGELWADAGWHPPA